VLQKILRRQKNSSRFFSSYALFNQIEFAQHQLNVDENDANSSGEESHITKDGSRTNISETD
jgi:hypothetical protein